MAPVETPPVHSDPIAALRQASPYGPWLTVDSCSVLFLMLPDLAGGNDA